MRAATRAEDADFHSDLDGSGKAESKEMANAFEIDLDRSFEEIGVVATIVPEEIDDQNQNHVETRDGSGPAGAFHSHLGEAELAVDECVVEEEIDEIGGDEGECDGADHVHGLEGAANGEVEKKREHAGGEGVGVGDGEVDDGGFHVDALEERAEEKDGSG